MSRPRADIHLGALVANWRRLAALAPASETGAVVKADAYGHGLAEAGRALAGAGCRHFFVAYPHEGVALRAAVGAGPQVHVFHGTASGDDTEGLAAMVEHGLTPVLNDLAGLALWLGAAPARPYGLHIDTGMNRLGLRPDEVGEAVNLTAERPPALVMSHYACADAPDDPMNARQAETFARLAAAFPQARPSLCNTAGLFLGGQMAGAVNRPGIGLYGGGTSPLQPELEAALTLTAPVLTVKTVPAGESVGYGATARLGREATLATVALGYGDGFPRSLGNRGFGVIAGTEVPIVGRVSMDLITLDVSAAKTFAKPGARVEFIGAAARLERQAALAGTLGYELTTRLGPRVERRFHP